MSTISQLTRLPRDAKETFFNTLLRLTDYPLTAGLRAYNREIVTPTMDAWMALGKGEQYREEFRSAFGRDPDFPRWSAPLTIPRDMVGSMLHGGFKNVRQPVPADFFREDLGYGPWSSFGLGFGASLVNPADPLNMGAYRMALKASQEAALKAAASKSGQRVLETAPAQAAQKAGRSVRDLFSTTTGVQPVDRAAEAAGRVTRLARYDLVQEANQLSKMAREIDKTSKVEGRAAELIEMVSVPNKSIRGTITAEEEAFALRAHEYFKNVVEYAGKRGHEIVTPEARIRGTLEGARQAHAKAVVDLAKRAESSIPRKYGVPDAEENLRRAIYESVESAGVNPQKIGKPRPMVSEETESGLRMFRHDTRYPLGSHLEPNITAASDMDRYFGRLSPPHSPTLYQAARALAEEEGPEAVDRLRALFSNRPERFASTERGAGAGVTKRLWEKAEGPGFSMRPKPIEVTVDAQGAKNVLRGRLQEISEGMTDIPAKDVQRQLDRIRVAERKLQRRLVAQERYKMKQAYKIDRLYEDTVATAQEELLSRPNYLPHMLRDDVVKDVFARYGEQGARGAGAGGLLLSDFDKFQLARDFSIYAKPISMDSAPHLLVRYPSILEANTANQTGRLMVGGKSHPVEVRFNVRGGSVPAPAGKPLFVDDVTEILASYAPHTARAIGGDVFETMIRKMGREQRDEAVGALYERKFVVDGKEVSRWYDKGTYDAMTKASSAWQSDAYTNALQRFHKDMVAYWKIDKLMHFPFNVDTTLRNLGGNTFNSFLTMDDLARELPIYTRSAKEASAFLGRMWTGNATAADMKHYRYLVGEGVLEDTFAQELYRRAQRGAGQTKFRRAWRKPYNPGSLEWMPFRVGMKMFQGVEEFSKVALFNHRMKMGDSAAEAARVVRKHLFDYQNLSKGDRTIRDYFSPFWTWLRRNIPLQLEHMVKKPGHYQRVASGVTNWQGSTPEGWAEVQTLPEWVSRTGAVKIGEAEGTPYYKDITDYGPQGDPFGILEAPVRGLASTLGPQVQMPYEALSGKRIFADMPVEKREGELMPFMGGRLPVPALVGKPLLSLSQPLYEIDRILTPPKLERPDRPAGAEWARFFLGRVEPAGLAAQHPTMGYLTKELGTLGKAATTEYAAAKQAAAKGNQWQALGHWQEWSRLMHEQKKRQQELQRRAEAARVLKEKK